MSSSERLQRAAGGTELRSTGAPYLHAVWVWVTLLQNDAVPSCLDAKARRLRTARRCGRGVQRAGGGDERPVRVVPATDDIRRGRTRRSVRVMGGAVAGQSAYGRPAAPDAGLAAEAAPDMGRGRHGGDERPVASSAALTIRITTPSPVAGAQGLACWRSRSWRRALRRRFGPVAQRAPPQCSRGIPLNEVAGPPHYAQA
jgi:hypothetical protein